MVVSPPYSISWPHIRGSGNCELDDGTSLGISSYHMAGTPSTELDRGPQSNFSFPRGDKAAFSKHKSRIRL